MTTAANVQQRIAAIEPELKATEDELVSLKAKIAGRKESVAQQLRAENQALKERVSLLVEIAHSLSMDALHPSEEGAARLQLERIKQAVVTFCTQSNIDPGLWKKLAS
jgi:hypothetical protein